MDIGLQLCAIGALKNIIANERKNKNSYRKSNSLSDSIVLISTTVLYLFMGSVKKVGAAVIIIETFKTIEFYFFDELFTKYAKRRRIRKV